VLFRGKSSIADVLDMTVEEALDFFNLRCCAS
jgi:excinuclease UvrABC ATPase subunit